MTKILELINGIVWGAPALVLILGVGLYLTIRTGFVQMRLFPRSLSLFARRMKPDPTQQEGVSPFRALCTALAATVGTGNLAGVAGAICLGGPGAIFWMWVCAFFGMVTKFAEAALAVRYRVQYESGELAGGPMYIIHQGMGKRFHWLASVYAFFGVVAAFGVGNATQINAVIDGINQAMTAFGGTPSRTGNLLMGGLLAVVITLMLLGGAKRIGAVAELLVPFASAAYLLLGMGVLMANGRQIPDAMGAILQGAFSPKAVTGGMLGSAFQALRVGISRGVFTNEAGMGTAAMAHGSAQVNHPVEQGMMGIVEVFLDTIVICTMTALVILTSGVAIPYGVDTGVELTTQAFASVYGDWVSIPMALFLCCFAFATVLGWGLYGARCAQYLFGQKAWKAFALLQGVTVLLSAGLQTGTIWMLSETVNGLMSIPNLIALAGTGSELARLTKDYQKQNGSFAACGGTNANFHQRQPLRTVSNAEIPPAGGGSGKEGQNHLPSEYWTAGSGNAQGLL